MLWFIAFVAVAVIGVAAVVATGRGGGMAAGYDDRPDVRVPADRRLEAADLTRVRFSVTLRGYRMSEVDALLRRLAAEMADRDHDTRADTGHPDTAERADED